MVIFKLNFEKKINHVKLIEILKKFFDLQF
jgi:hypothetical protein